MAYVTTLRDAFWDKIYDMARANPNLILVAADMAAPSLDKFRRDMRLQYIDVGIAEQQAVAVAAGMALGGKKVFAYAIAPFITLRCYEHTRVALSCMNVPVTLVGVGAGFSYDDSGPTHHTVDDISCLRILPHMEINNISDPMMCVYYAEKSVKNDHPNYVRLDRQALPQIYKEDTDFSGGVQTVIDNGGEIVLVATGNMVHRAIDAAKVLGKKGIRLTVLDLHSIPIKVEPFLAKIRKAKHLFTLEEHTLPGGMGGTVAELLCDQQLFIPLRRIGCDFSNCYCYKYGGRENLQKVVGIDLENVTKIIQAELKK